jgi:hypothetical protein
LATIITKKTKAKVNTYGAPGKYRCQAGAGTVMTPRTSLHVILLPFQRNATTRRMRVIPLANADSRGPYLARGPALDDMAAALCEIGMAKWSACGACWRHEWICAVGAHSGRLRAPGGFAWPMADGKQIPPREAQAGMGKGKRVLNVRARGLGMRRESE